MFPAQEPRELGPGVGITPTGVVDRFICEANAVQCWFVLQLFGHDLRPAADGGFGLGMENIKS